MVVAIYFPGRSGMMEIRQSLRMISKIALALSRWVVRIRRIRWVRWIGSLSGRRNKIVWWISRKAVRMLSRKFSGRRSSHLSNPSIRITPVQVSFFSLKNKLNAGICQKVSQSKALTLGFFFFSLFSFFIPWASNTTASRSLEADFSAGFSWTGRAAGAEDS